jgi:hypothetical protein
MARLTYGERKSMPKSEFAVPSKREGGKGGYPIPDRNHARSALQRASEFGTPKVKAEVREKVEKKFPGMEKGKSRGKVPRGEHHESNHREPRNHAEFERLGNDGKGRGSMDEMD